MKKKIGNKEESSHDYCFSCKDGGLLRVCDYKKCLKPYHHFCVEKDESFLNDDTTWICGLHSCYTCGRSSVYKCICCPTAYCRACFISSNFAIVRKKMQGVCLSCAKMIKMIEEDVHINSDGEEVDFDKRDTWEFLFKDYWRLIKEEEELTLMDIQTATAIVQRCKERPNDSNYNGTIDVESMTESDESDSEHESEGEKSRKRSRAKLYNKAQIKTPKKERAFIGWASPELIKFLTSVGKSTTEQLSQQEVTDTIKDYVQANNLFQMEKKRRNYIVPDEKLYTLFRKKKLKYHKIYDLVKKHLVNARSDDDLISISEDDDASVPVKKQRNVQLENNISESKLINCSKHISKRSKSCYAALTVENMKLIFLKRSLIVELSKTPESFETKVVGCFVRIKNDPKEFMYSVHKGFQIGQILGVKESEVPYTIGERSTKVVLRVSNIAKDIKLSMLTEGEIEEEECADLRQLVKSGLFTQPTIAEFERKIKVIHEDITNHWIDRELVRLTKLIELSNEKGWRKELDEYIDKRELLCKPEERIRRLKEIPDVIPDEERMDEPSYPNRVNEENKINVNLSAQAENFSKTMISDNQCIGENEEVNENAAIWHYTDSSGIDQGPFTLLDLKHWKNGGYFEDDFKIWKSGQCKKDGVLLIDALASESL